MIYLYSMIAEHIRSIVVGILVLGGMASFCILYVLLSAPIASSEDVPEGGENMSFAASSREDLLLYIQKKQKAARSVPTVSQSSFFIPSGL